MSFLEIKNLTKKYGNLKALDGINLSFPRGRIIGLLGKNGAGKSTLMRCMLGFLKYKGEISFLGKPVLRNDTNIFKKVAFIPDVSGLDDRLTVKQSIDFVSRVNPSWKESTALNLLSKSKLPLKQKIGNLSKGMKTKLYLLLTLSLDVDLLLLDEPTLGLDIEFRKEFFNTILGEFFDDNKTIIISTHQVEEIEHILQDIVFMNDGKVLLHENIDEMKSKYSNIIVPVERRKELMDSNARQINYMLGKISAIVSSDVKIDGAEYKRPLLSDLFLAELGGER
ncbi:MAG: multidrug ABC transporter ATP-binding protein [Candidatus Cloacimonadota bacterium]|nr:MAG: multidrug ABC transporter ATP-binding protein [Candidatus Cloacimonadota bacterium]